MFFAAINICKVIKYTKVIFSRHRLPVTGVSDNGPQFSSQENKDSADSYGFEHITTVPHFPQSNSMSEECRS